ncbi:MAG: alpha/beta hydrolase [Atopobiaceae bacterium]|nr:alpha/beta hydrolase [Atopobiaceae bacterium]
MTKGLIDVASRKVYRAESDGVPLIYVVDSPEHPFDEASLSSLAQRLASNVVTVPVANWNDALTPWPAAGLYRGEREFGGCAASTLAELVSEVAPAIESAEGLCPSSRSVCGYSLGGLFALYALTHSDFFDACACLSGSVWYEGWVEHLQSLKLDLAGRFAFLSLGTKERRAARPILKTVQDRMEQCVEALQEHGCEVEYRLGPGNHMQHVSERLEAGLIALDEFLR